MKRVNHAVLWRSNAGFNYSQNNDFPNSCRYALAISGKILNMLFSGFCVPVPAPSVRVHVLI